MNRGSGQGNDRRNAGQNVKRQGNGRRNVRQEEGRQEKEIRNAGQEEGRQEKEIRNARKKATGANRPDDEEQIEKQVSEMQQHEDAALKTGMRFFAEELLPYLGIEGKVVGYAPTELVHLEMKKFLQDFNVVMDDGSWKHFEFQSKNEGTKGLRRFHAYEALTEYQYGVSVTTYVLFSGKIRRPMTELVKGAYTYRIVPVIMKGRNADKLIMKLKEKQARGESLTREELVPLTLCLLMDGESSQKERVKASFEITRKAVDISTEDISKIEAVVYVMADKFLDQTEMEEIKEGIRMTQLGQMLVEMGRDEGRREGRREGRKEVNKLYNSLIREGRYDELKRATEDTEYQNLLFAEYGIS